MGSDMQNAQKQQKVLIKFITDLSYMRRYSNNKRHIKENSNTFIRKNPSRFLKT